MRSSSIIQRITKIFQMRLFSFKYVLLVESLTFFLDVVDVFGFDYQMSIVQVLQYDFVVVFVVEKDNELLRRNVPVKYGS